MIEIKEIEIPIQKIIDTVEETGSVHKSESILGISHKTIERRLKKHSTILYKKLTKTKKDAKKEKFENFNMKTKDILENLNNVESLDKKRYISQNELRRKPTLNLILKTLKKRNKKYDENKIIEMVNFVYNRILEMNLNPRGNNIVAASITYCYYKNTDNKMTLDDIYDIFKVTSKSIKLFLDHIKSNHKEIYNAN